MYVELVCFPYFEEVQIFQKKAMISGIFDPYSYLFDSGSVLPLPNYLIHGRFHFILQSVFSAGGGSSS
jgi:hypothetical protein